MATDEKNNNPLAEVFGFPIINETAKAKRYRDKKLCPFNNKVPNCTKDKANDPLGVCSVFHNNNPVITCPTRFREDWLIIENAAKFAFDEKAKWTSLSEIKLLDKNGQSAGNIDFVLVAYNDKGQLTDFASLEVQGVYISGNLRNPFDSYINNAYKYIQLTYGYSWPKPVDLSSSRKRFIPQMLYKGGIFKLGERNRLLRYKNHSSTRCRTSNRSKKKADIDWFLYDLVFDKATYQYNLAL
jgi:hypothetical protein